MGNRKKIISLLIALLIGMAVCFAGCSSESGEESGLNLNKKNQTVSDKDTLIQLLEAPGDYKITIAEDIYLDTPVSVYGNKTLTGDKSLIMELWVEQYQHMLVVKKDASLTLDGAVIDGNGAASCVKVEAGAKMDLLSGEVIWGCPYGIEAYGDVNITGGAIRETVNTGLYVRSGANAYMTAGEIADGSYTGAKIEKDAYMSISDDAVIVNNKYTLVYNNGKCDITGGEMHDGGTYIAYNFGDLNVQYTGDDPNGRLEWYNAGMHIISQGNTGTLTVDGLSAANAGWHGISTAIGSADLNLKNIEIEDIAQAAFYLRSDATLENIAVNECGTAGVYVGNGSTVDIKKLSVTNSGGRGIWNFGGNVTAKDVTITNSKEFGVTSTYFEGLPGFVTIENLLIDGVETDQGLSANQSTITVNGGIIRNIRGANRVAAYAKNGGKLNLTDVEITDVAFAGVYIDGADCVANLENVTTTGGKRGICAYNKAAVEGKNITINDTTEYSIASSHQGTTVNITDLDINNCKYSTRGAVNIGSSTMTLKNARITRPAHNGIDVNEGGKLTAVNVAVIEPGNCGMNIIGGYVTGSDVYVTSAANYGIYVQQDKGNAGKSTFDNLQIYGSCNQGIASNGSSVYVNGGIIQNVTGDQRCGAAAFNGGYLSVKDVTFDKINYAAVYSQASTINVENITVTNARRGVCAYEGGTVAGKNVKIDGTTEYSIAASNEKTVIDLTDVQITNCKNNGKGAVNVGGANVTLTDVNIVKPAGNGADINENGTLTLKNAVITEPANCGLNIIGGNVNGDTVTITKPGNYGIYAQKEGSVVGKSEIKNLTIDTVANNHAISSNGTDISVDTATIKNVTGAAKCGAYAVNGGKLNLKDVTFADITYVSVYSQSADITVDNVSITGGKRGIAAYSGGSVTGKDVAIDGTSEFSITSSNTGTTIDLTGVDITNCRYSGGGAVNVGGSTTSLTDLTIDGAAGHGINVDGNGQLNLNGATIKNVTKWNGINLNGGTITGSDVTIDKPTYRGIEVVNGNITLAGLNITNSPKNGILVTKGVCDISDVSVSNAGEHGIEVKANGELKINKATLSNNKLNAIFVEGGKAAGGDITIDSKAHGMAFSGGTVNLDKVTINSTGTGNQGVNIYNKANVTLSNLTIAKAGVHGINLEAGSTLALHTASIANIGTYNGIYVNGGTLTGGSVTITAPKYNGIEVLNGGSATLDSLTVTGAPRNGVLVTKGTCDVKNVNISGSGYHGIDVEAAGTLSVNGGSITGNALNAIFVKGGKVTGAGDVTLDSKYHGIAAEGGSVNLTGNVNITNAARIGVNVYGSANVTIGSVTIGKTGDHGVSVNPGTLTINGGSITNAGAGTTNKVGAFVAGKSTLNLNNVTITNPAYVGVYTDSAGNTINLNTVTVDGGQRGIANYNSTLTGKTVTIKNTSNYAIASANAGTVINIDGLNISNCSATHAAVNAGGSSVTLANATITGVPNGHGINLDSSGTLNLTNVSISNVGLNGINAAGGTVTANGLTITGAKQDGINLSKGTCTVTTANLSNVTRYGVAVASGTSMTINGGTFTNLSGYGAYVDAGSITLNGVSFTSLKRGIQVNNGGTVNGTDVSIQTTSEAAISANGNLTFKGLTIKDAKNLGVNLNNNAVAVMEDVLIDGTTYQSIGLYQNAKLTLTNATLINHNYGALTGAVEGTNYFPTNVATTAPAPEAVQENTEA